ncbi:PTS system, beta-glucoside-specific IIABC component [Williamsoniiplasma luminosum]|uniref:PTS system, beta-glucoside-specific IIABC component n=1 Tax=Williamsoniiplasma luminosum TaxID=214888 RepID=A0A2K8NUW9_9MOLU|nr:glucose PTS transporter subunit IIA [Williamsoniiplasma luminosum]ATZ17564.1 PTS system, beta-glucoside-specific IIABC component [Williamsoniiplasma luminosum]
MEKIVIYSPVDGEIKQIEKISDPIFAEKMLGDGFYIEPKNNKIFSPFENGEIINIFETKHAIHIKADQGPIILMHFGLETVNLAGQPFNMKVKNGQKINLKNELVEVNWSEIKKKKLPTSTPMVIDPNDNPGWTIGDIKYGLVKQGEPIATLSYTQPKVDKEAYKAKPINLKEALKNGIRFTNRYEELARNIYDLVGGKTNYNRYYNCATRLRFTIKDEKLVDVNKIKKIDVVKGISWNKGEFQVIIGGEVEKVKDGLDNYLMRLQQEPDFVLKNQKGYKEKQSFGKSILNLVRGIVLPSIPIMIGVGILNAMSAVLQQTGAIQNVSPSANFGSYTLATQLVYLIAGGATLFMGIFFTYNGVKYFGGNPLLGLTMGLILTAPVIFKGNLSYNQLTGGMTATPWSLPILTSKIDGLDFVWMKIGPSPGSLLTCSIIAYITVKAEKYAKRTFPDWSLTLTVSTFTIFVASILAFFLVGPLISVVEGIIAYLFSWVNKIPYGLSVAVFAFFWEILVIWGAHFALISVINQPMLNDPDPYIQGLKTIDIMVGIAVAVFGQVAAAMGFLFTTRNASIRQILASGIPIGLFGIPEPEIFGINLPRVKPLFFGCTGAAIAGWVAAIMGAKFYPGIKTGMGGVLSLLNANGPNGDTKSLIATSVGFILSFAIPILLTAFFCKERPSEKTGLYQATKSLNRFLDNKNVAMDAKLQQEVDDLKTFYNNKEVTKKIKLFENHMAKIQSLENKINILETKNLERKEALAKRFSRVQEKLEEQKNVDQIMKKLDQIINKINTPKYDAKIAELEKMLQQARDNNAPIEAEVERLTQDNILKVKKIGDKVHKLTNSELTEKISNKYYNAINSVYINYGFTSKKDVKFSKLEKQELKATNTK